MVSNRQRPQSSGSASPEEWGQRLRRGEAGAVSHVRERVRRILSYRRIGIPDQARDDLEQEIMTELWQAVNRSSFDFTSGFWGFVEVVTSRRCIDWRRSNRRESLPLVGSFRDAGKSPVERLLDGERSEIALQILQALDPTCRRLITMRLREGLSYREVAKTLGKSEGAVRVQMHRCIRSAQQIVEAMDSGRRRSTQGECDGSS